jgi:hypothetical protein
LTSNDSFEEADVASEDDEPEESDKEQPGRNDTDWVAPAAGEGLPSFKKKKSRGSGAADEPRKKRRPAKKPARTPSPEIELTPEERAAPRELLFATDSLG